MFSMCYQLFEKYHKRKKLFRIKSILNLYSLEVIMTSTRIRKISFAFLKNRFHTFRYNMLLTLRKIYHYIVARYWTLREKKMDFVNLLMTEIKWKYLLESLLYLKISVLVLTLVDFYGFYHLTLFVFQGRLMFYFYGK